MVFFFGGGWGSDCRNFEDITFGLTSAETYGKDTRTLLRMEGEAPIPPENRWQLRIRVQTICAAASSPDLGFVKRLQGHPF